VLLDVTNNLVKQLGGWLLLQLINLSRMQSYHAQVASVHVISQPANFRSFLAPAATACLHASEAASFL
jgi:hypothetical protein